MTCDVFLDRLYDDDVRAAQRGESSVPPDMAQHLLVCDECRAEYAAACADETHLALALFEPAPPAWRAEVLHRIERSPRPAWTRRIAITNEVVTWGTLAVAASHLLLGEHSTAVHVAAFMTGGAAAVLRTNLGRDWMVLVHRTLRLV